MLITKWTPALLLMELDNVLWGDNDSISIKKLWDYLCTYCYLPRLANYGVLEDAIRNGLNSSEYYALAAAISGEWYLKYNQYVGMIDMSAHLVKIMAALKQIAEDKAKVQAEDGKAASITYPQGGLQPGHVNESGEYGDGSSVPVSGVGSGIDRPVVPQPPQPKNMRFYMSAKLDNTRINRDVQKLVEEVISHLTNVDGAKVEVT